MSRVRWHGLEPLLTRSGPLESPGFEPSPLNIEDLHSRKVLVVGAGGLGCELLKLLALSGFTDITVIDMDTVDISNLNRQFLFRKKHVGRYKSEVAAEAIMTKYPHVSVKWEKEKVQSYSKKWFSAFNIVIAGLDNVEARRWINKTLNDMVQFEDGQINPDTMIPLIDGGTEGLRGQARLFFPKATSCYECSVSSINQGTHYHQCTLANVPRIPEHCIQYVREILWDRLEDLQSADEYKLYVPKGDDDTSLPRAVKLDTDNIQHMSWIHARAVERADAFKIQGVTFKLTMQVVKNIIPAVASTNAIIAAQCVLEAVKVLTRCSQVLNNFMFFNGVALEACDLYEYQKNPNCTACQMPASLMVSGHITLAQLRQRITDELKIESPDLGLPTGLLYMTNMHDMFKADLEKPISTLFSNHAAVTVTSGKLIKPIFVIFEENSN